MGLVAEYFALEEVPSFRLTCYAFSQLTQDMRPKLLLAFPRAFGMMIPAVVGQRRLTDDNGCWFGVSAWLFTPAPDRPCSPTVSFAEWNASSKRLFLEDDLDTEHPHQRGPSETRQLREFLQLVPASIIASVHTEVQPAAREGSQSRLTRFVFKEPIDLWLEVTFETKGNRIGLCGACWTRCYGR